MKEIEFHFNVPDKLDYGCRLLRKVQHRGMRAVVTAEPDLLTQLDQFLWSFSSTEFLPHCLDTAGVVLTDLTAIILSEQTGACSAEGVLINLGRKIPEGFDRFERFVELVSDEPEDRLAGRDRWKTYKNGGFELKRHDVAARKDTP